MSLFLYLIFFNVAWLGVNGWGPFKTILYSDYITCDHNKTLDLNVSEVQVYFYDFKNNFNISFKASDAAEGITARYNLDITRRLVFFVPGYKSHISKSNEELMRQTFKDVPNSYLIIIDHSEYTNKRGGKVKSYERSVLYTYYVGKALGKLLAEIHKKGYPAENIHCIGHSLGSQMLGYAGTEFTSMTSEKLWRITGIDPAGPCFSNGFIQDQIRSGVAEYVEVYHCNAGGLGTTSVLADADFFLNKGISQPDCGAGIIPTKGESDSAKCSHKACVRLWTDTVHHPGWYSAWKCDSFKDFKNGRCFNNEMAVAGYTNPGNASGVFYASTE